MSGYVFPSGGGAGGGSGFDGVVIPRIDALDRHGSVSWGPSSVVTVNAFTLFDLFPMPAPGTITHITVEVTTLQAGATARLGVYVPTVKDDPASGLTLVSDFGTVDCSSIGFKTAAGSALINSKFAVLALAASAHATQFRGILSSSGYGSYQAALNGYANISQGRQLAGWIANTNYSAGLPASVTPTIISGGTSAAIALVGRATYS